MWFIWTSQIYIRNKGLLFKSFLAQWFLIPAHTHTHLPTQTLTHTLTHTLKHTLIHTPIHVNMSYYQSCMGRICNSSNNCNTFTSNYNRVGEVIIIKLAVNVREKNIPETFCLFINKYSFILCWRYLNILKTSILEKVSLSP